MVSSEKPFLVALTDMPVKDKRGQGQSSTPDKSDVYLATRKLSLE